MNSFSSDSSFENFSLGPITKYLKLTKKNTKSTPSPIIRIGTFVGNPGFSNKKGDKITITLENPVLKVDKGYSIMLDKHGVAYSLKTNNMQMDGDEDSSEMSADAVVEVSYWRDPKWYASHAVVLLVAFGIGYFVGKKYGKK